MRDIAELMCSLDEQPVRLVGRALDCERVGFHYPDTRRRACKRTEYRRILNESFCDRLRPVIVGPFRGHHVLKGFKIGRDVLARCGHDGGRHGEGEAICRNELPCFGSSSGLATANIRMKFMKTTTVRGAKFVR